MSDSRATGDERRGMDRPLFLTVILLVAFGVVMVYSASAVTAAQKMNNYTFFLGRQVVYATAGLFFMLVISRIDYHVFQKSIIVWSLLGMALERFSIRFQLSIPLSVALGSLGIFISITPMLLF